MPAYSFQERFVPMIQDGSKTHTVRAPRKGRSGHAMPGDMIYLYFGMRTKWCKKLGEAVCTRRDEIVISEAGIVINGKLLPMAEANLFAWRDGFRPEGSTADNPADSLILMLRFWRQAHQLPFLGWVMHWGELTAPQGFPKVRGPIYEDEDPDLYFTPE